MDKFFEIEVKVTPPYPRDDIIRMAQEAGFVVDEKTRQHQPNCIFHTWHMIDEGLARFAALVAAAEREACAKVCDHMATVPLYAAPPQRKPLTEEQVDRAYQEIWRDSPDDFGPTAGDWIEAGIRYAERLHGITGDKDGSQG